MNSYQSITGTAEPLSDDILVYEMETGEKLTKGGIMLLNDSSFTDATQSSASAGKGIRSRWAKVYKVGSNVDYVSPGELVLVEHGRWTYALKFTDETGTTINLQKIDPSAIILIADADFVE